MNTDNTGNKQEEIKMTSSDTLSELSCSQIKFSGLLVGILNHMEE